MKLNAKLRNTISAAVFAFSLFCFFPGGSSAEPEDNPEDNKDSRKETAEPALSAGRSANIAWANIAFESDSDFSGDGGGASARVSEIHAGVAFPLILSRKLRLIAGLHSAGREFAFSGLATKNIRVYDLSLPIIAMLPLADSRLTMMAMWTPGFHTDFDTVDHNDFKSGFLLAADYAVLPTLRLAAGAAYSRVFGEDKLFPAVGLTWKPSEKWTLRLLYPKPALVYAATEKIRLSAGMEPAGGKWNISDPRPGRSEESEYDFDVKGWRVGMSAEYDFTAMLTAVVDVFAVVGKEYKIENDNETVLNAEADEAFGARVGIALRRPRGNRPASE